jgi:hypothetical protein
VTRTAGLCFASGPTTRKTAVLANGGLSSRNSPRGPVTPVAASCHAAEPPSRSNSRTGAPAGGRATLGDPAAELNHRAGRDPYP